jgi:long-chain fatty acid transport protein
MLPAASMTRGEQPKARPSPPPARVPGRRGVGLLCAAWVVGLAAAAAAQVPTPSPSPELPELPPDELDFQGLTSITLGSGARAFGMGGAFLARADDATAASWNPAGLSYLRNPEISIVGARNSFDRGPEGEPANDTFDGRTPDFAAVAYPLEFGSVTGAVQLSYQRVFSFRGSRTVDKEGFVLTTDGTGGYDVLAFGTGLQVSRSLRAGITLNRWLNGYHQTRARTGLRRQRQELDYDLSGWNVNLGLMWTPQESVNLGLVAKTPFTGSLTLRRDRTDIFANETPPVFTTTTNGAASDDLSLDFPAAVGLGASWRPRSALTLSMDYTRTLWSEGRIHNFFTVPPTPPSPVNAEPPDPIVFSELPYPTLVDLDQEDTYQLRMGAEYVIIASHLKVPLRAGYFLDRQYFRAGDGSAPVFDGFTVGAGILAGPFLFDVAYLHESGSYLDSGEPQGRAFTTFSRVFVSLIYRHGASR